MWEDAVGARGRAAFRVHLHGCRSVGCCVHCISVFDTCSKSKAQFPAEIEGF